MPVGMLLVLVGLLVILVETFVISLGIFVSRPNQVCDVCGYGGDCIDLGWEVCGFGWVVWLGFVCDLLLGRWWFWLGVSWCAFGFLWFSLGCRRY